MIDRAGSEHCLCADTLWREGLTLVYRLLFILKLESAAEPGSGFSFASTNLWRTSLSPNRALGPLVRRMLDHGHDTGCMLEDGLRLLFRVFRDGLSTSELSIAPLGGALFGDGTTPLLDSLAWGERACAQLLDRLLWTKPKGRGRERVHYGSLDVEDLVTSTRRCSNWNRASPSCLCHGYAARSLRSWCRVMPVPASAPRSTAVRGRIG